MAYFLYVICRTVLLFVVAMQGLMFVRALLSWLPVDPDGPIVGFVWAVTEFLLAPIRYLLFKLFPKTQEFPIDISFMVTILLLFLMELVLRYFY